MASKYNRVGLVVSMGRKAGFWVDPSDTDANGNFGPTRGSSRPPPQDGVRLMRAFIGLKQPALRQAVIDFVAKLSALDEHRE